MDSRDSAIEIGRELREKEESREIHQRVVVVLKKRRVGEKERRRRTKFLLDVASSVFRDPSSFQVSSLKPNREFDLLAESCGSSIIDHLGMDTNQKRGNDIREIGMRYHDTKSTCLLRFLRSVRQNYRFFHHDLLPANGSF